VVEDDFARNDEMMPLPMTSGSRLLVSAVMPAKIKPTTLPMNQKFGLRSTPEVDPNFACW
jgi:hypothetical protein